MQKTSSKSLFRFRALARRTLSALVQTPEGFGEENIRPDASVRGSAKDSPIRSLRCLLALQPFEGSGAARGGSFGALLILRWARVR